MSAQIEYTSLTICCERPLEEREATLLRGFFGQRYRNRPEFHHHGHEGLIYRHPLIQYKVIGGAGRLTGIGAGSYLLQAVETPHQLLLNGQGVEVINTHRTTEMISFGPINHLIDYRFLTPWLGLNEANYSVFKELKEKGKRIELLNRILVGNLLSLCKSLEYEVEERLHALVHLEHTGSVNIKDDVELIGLSGAFSVNFLLPPLWGIGKQSARGFGVTHKIGG